MEFGQALERFGFRQVERSGFGRSGSVVYVSDPNRYITYTVQAEPDGTATFSWEFALGEYLLTKGIQVGSDETLNQFAYPRQDTRGPQDGAWLAAAVEQAEAQLAEVRLDRPEA